MHIYCVDCSLIPGLNGAEESGMIGENMEGFISCIGRGVNGVNVPPEIRLFLLSTVSIGGEQWIRKVGRFSSFYVLDLVQDVQTNLV